jgi:hypothetical protein
MTTEWIEHHGKGYPDLPLDTLVHVRFANGEESTANVAFWGWRWGTPTPHSFDITHYRVVE